MRIVMTSVLVDDQDKALAFYTDVLGFVKKTRCPGRRAPLADASSRPTRPTARARCSSPTSTPRRARSSARWSTTASRSRPSASTTSSAEHERLQALGVRFTQQPLTMGPVTTAVLDDTCGNLIQIASQA